MRQMATFKSKFPFPIGTMWRLLLNILQFLSRAKSANSNAMYAKSGLRVFSKWMIYRSGSVITDVIPLEQMNDRLYDHDTSRLWSLSFLKQKEDDALRRIMGLGGTLAMLRTMHQAKSTAFGPISSLGKPIGVPLFGRFLILVFFALLVVVYAATWLGNPVIWAVPGS
jgi:hypothetical protein